MICYLIRHGKDDETVRGGWSIHPLTEEGIRQVNALAEAIACKQDTLQIRHIYSSDLPRAMQTAKTIAERLAFPVVPLPVFREANNGELAGMKNTLAVTHYPDLFWNQLEWEQCYPGGESPKQFYERIYTAWEGFSKKILSENENVVLVTHGGVIHVILSLIVGRPYSNRENQRSIPHASMLTLSYENGAWKEIL